MPISPMGGMATATLDTISDKEAILTGQGIDKGALPQSSNVVRYYYFSEGSGSTLADASGNGADASLEGSYSWASGFDGYGGVHFTGGTADMSGQLPSFSEHTMLCVKESDPQSDKGAIWYFAQDQNWGQWVENNSQEVQALYNDGGYNWIPGYSYNDGEWYLTGSRWDGSTQQTLVGTDQTISGESANPSTGDIGAETIAGYSSGTEQWEGTMSLLVVWDSHLSDSEIDQLANDLELP